MDVRQRVLAPYKPKRHYLEPDGSVTSGSAGELRAITRLLVPLFLSVLMTMALMGTSSYLVQGIASEKENKVVEVLLSAARPEEILAGKLLGLGAAGLLQVAIWAVMFGGGGVLAATQLAAPEIAVPWQALALSPVYFILGYLFVGSLMLATGALGTTARESQQMAMLWSTPTLLPVLMAPVLAAEPDGVLCRLLTQVPFTAPLTAILRLSVDPSSISNLEIATSIAVLGVCTWVSLRVGARLFRIGLLMTGARPSIAALLRQAALRR